MTRKGWSDNHPKSPWISVADDLPCNHKELLLSTGYHTVSGKPFGMKEE